MAVKSVYLLGPLEGCYKIGQSERPGERVKSLNLPLELSSLATLTTSRDEWFRLTDEEVAILVSVSHARDTEAGCARPRPTDLRPQRTEGDSMALLTKDEIRTLQAFVQNRVPASRWELFGTDNALAVGGWIHALCEKGMLEAIPAHEQADRHGGTRFRVRPAAYKALDLPVPGAASTYIPAANRGKKLGHDAPLVSNGRRRKVG